MDDHQLVLSSLGHTWIFDLDGTIMKHNGYKLDGEDTFLPGALEFLHDIPKTDMIIFLTSRTEQYRETTVKALEREGVRFDHIIFQAPYGERILVNDNKPSGLVTGLAVNTQRDVWSGIRVEIDPEL